MLRYIQVINAKNAPLMKTSAACTRGMAVAVDYAAGTVAPAASGTGVRLADAPNNYDGINSVIAPNDGSFEDIASGAIIPTVVPKDGEKYGTTCVTATGLAEGDYLAVKNGMFEKAGKSTAVEWVYRGTYKEPSAASGIGYVIEKIPAITTAAS